MAEHDKVPTLFAHDHRFWIAGNDIFSEGKFGDFKQYTDVLGKIVVLARSSNEHAQSETGSLQRLDNPCVRIAEVRSLGAAFRPMQLMRIWREVRQVRAVVARLPSVLGLMALIFARLQRKPSLIELAGCPWDSLRHHSHNRRLAAPLIWGLTRTLVSRSMHVVYVTDGFLQKRYPTRGKSAAISNVAIDQVDPSILARRLDWLQSRGSRLILGTVANVDIAYKGQAFVIQALPALISAGIDVEYHLVGGGSSVKLANLAVEVGVEERVQFLGPMSHDAVLQWLESIDLYLQPSLTEGLPRALIEAMSRGVPAVGSAVGGIPELLRASYLFEASNSRDITTAVRRILADGLAVAAANNFERARRYYRGTLAPRRTAFLKDFIHDQ